MKLLSILLVMGFTFLSCANESKRDEMNILLITVDDMNWNSVGVFGCNIPDITPNIDRLAESGMRFEHAYVQASNCSPSRCVLQAGRYPHQTGMRGFYYVEVENETLPEVLKHNGYITGIINKVADNSLSPDFQKYWDFTGEFTGAQRRSSTVYGEQLVSFLNNVNTGSKPFYCVINIADPHKPFFNDEQSIERGFDRFEPSHIFTLDDVEIPGFLPEAPQIKQEVLNYYNSVKRADDCVGAVLDVLNKSKYSENTMVFFISDHGMPMPFAKSSVYQHGIRTPWIVSCPGVIKSGRVDSEHLISSIDFLPTILDFIDIEVPSGIEGKSMVPLLKGAGTEPTECVFAQFDENAGGIPNPSRTVINKKYGYIFNAWATGQRRFKSAAEYHTTYGIMNGMATSDVEVQKRFNHWVYRSVEELYDYENDPDALHNLIDDPAYQEVANQLRASLERQMIKTDDYILPAFQHRNDPDYLNDWMQKQDEEAILRSQNLQWKRYKNRSGLTKENTGLFNVTE